MKIGQLIIERTVFTKWVIVEVDSSDRTVRAVSRAGNYRWFRTGEYMQPTKADLAQDISAAQHSALKAVGFVASAN